MCFVICYTSGGATGADGMPDISQLLMQLQNPEIISALSADPELLSAFSVSTYYNSKTLQFHTSWNGNFTHMI